MMRKDKDRGAKDQESIFAQQYQDKYLKIVDKGEKNDARYSLEKTREIRKLA